MFNILCSRLTSTGRRRIRLLGGRRTAAAAVLGTVALLGGCGTGDGTGTAESPDASPTRAASPQASDTSSESPSAKPTTKTTSPSPAKSAVPTVTPVATAKASGVWFMVDTRTGLRLAREMRTLTGEDPGKEAVQAMVTGPRDPDYASPWNKATKVLGVWRRGEAITVNLSKEARTANIGSQGAALMIQQLVYTVTDAVDKDATVRLLIEGRSPGDLWGVVRWDDPVDRADPMEVRSFVQIDAPREGATASSPLTVKGDAAAFEANVPWRVLDAQGEEVKAGFTLTSEGQTFAPFSFRVKLQPGKYTVEITEDDPSGGEGGTPMSDTKRVTIE